MNRIKDFYERPSGRRVRVERVWRSTTFSETRPEAPPPRWRDPVEQSAFWFLIAFTSVALFAYWLWDSTVPLFFGGVAVGAATSLYLRGTR